jgi:hypothetical protein
MRACMQAISGIVNNVPKELGANFPFLICALQAHAKVLHRSVESDAPVEVTQTLFSQCKMLMVRHPGLCLSHAGSDSHNFCMHASQGQICATQICHVHNPNALRIHFASRVLGSRLLLIFELAGRQVEARVVMSISVKCMWPMSKLKFCPCGSELLYVCA